jgi:hypothetical protein
MAFAHLMSQKVMSVQVKDKVPNQNVAETLVNLRNAKSFTQVGFGVAFANIQIMDCCAYYLQYKSFLYMELWQYFWHESVYDKRAVLIMRI